MRYEKLTGKHKPISYNDAVLGSFRLFKIKGDRGYFIGLSNLVTISIEALIHSDLKQAKSAHFR